MENESSIPTPDSLADRNTQLSDTVDRLDKTIREQNTSISNHLDTIRKLRSDFNYLAQAMLSEADDHDMCSEYDAFVEKMNSNFQSSERLLKRAETVEFEVTVYVTATGRDIDEGEMLDHMLNCEYTIRRDLESAFDLDECEIDITS